MTISKAVLSQVTKFKQSLTNAPAYHFLICC